MNADTEPQVVPGGGTSNARVEAARTAETNERSRTCSVKVARVGVRQPFLHLDSQATHLVIEASL